jgi:hypothetical protein
MRLYSSAALLGVALVLLLQTGPGGCTLKTVDPSQALKFTLSVLKGENSAQLSLTATNTADSELILQFAGGQRFEFIAQEKSSKRILWRWSFAHAVSGGRGSEMVKPGESLKYTAEMAYAGLPATHYEISAFITHMPRPTKAPETLALDLTDKKTKGPYDRHLVGEIALDDKTTPATVFLQLINGTRLKLNQTPEVFQRAQAFPVEAWLSGAGSEYTLVDYAWVMAPLPENSQFFLFNYIVYSVSGGISGISKGIKIYGDGSFMVSCCWGDDKTKTGNLGPSSPDMSPLEPLLQFMTAQRLGDLKNEYGKPGKVADGFTEFLAVKNRKYYKQVTVYQDPDDPVPDAFHQMTRRIGEAVQFAEF